MAINRASLSDTHRRPRSETATRWTDRRTPTPARTAMVVVGFVLALVSLAIGSFALVQVWLVGADAVAAAPACSRGRLAMILAGGVGFAAGGGARRHRHGPLDVAASAESEADYTGPGDTDDMPQPPRVV